MKTSMGLLTKTSELILQENAVNNEVLNAFDELDRINGATAKSCKCTLIDDSKKGEWKVKVVFDWKIEKSTTKGKKPSDLEVIVVWKRDANGLGYEIESCKTYESED